VTTNPAMAWVIQVARNFASDLEDTRRRFRFLIRDPDTTFTASLDEVFKASGISAIRTPVRSPKANAFATGSRSRQSSHAPSASSSWTLQA
jgi:putative transposase